MSVSINTQTAGGSGTGSMTYPDAGVAISTGTAWDTSIDPSSLTGLTISGETPTGTMNGTNDTFTMSSALAATITVWGFYNVQLVIEDVDFTRTGAVCVFDTIRPNSADSDTLVLFG